MSQRVRVGVIGATGLVGQNYVRLLSQNPWFDVAHVAASPRSAGKRYREGVDPDGRAAEGEGIPGLGAADISSFAHAAEPQRVHRPKRGFEFDNHPVRMHNGFTVI